MLTLFSAQAWSESWFKNTNVYARVGYSIGGTAPLDMPATIRKLNSYSPRSNVNAGVELYKPLNSHWGMATGIYIENKGMKTDATVKNYHMEITRGGETLEGLFTGNVSTTVRQWMWTLPILATYELGSHFRLKSVLMAPSLHPRVLKVLPTTVISEKEILLATRFCLAMKKDNVEHTISLRICARCNGESKLVATTTSASTGAVS